MPTPLPPIQMSSFQEQVCKWLTETRLQFEVTHLEYFTTRIAVLRDKAPTLTLALISLENWLEAGSPDRWQDEINAMRATREKSLKCVVIWEDYWIRKESIVKSRLNAMLGNSQKIAARLTQVRRIDQESSVQFLEKNHLNGSVTSKTRYGLFLPKRYFRVLNEAFEYDRQLEELLVAVSTFSAPRVFTRDDGPFRSFEMLRFASLLHTNVSGGLDKLLTAFAREKNPDDIMTYADLEWSDGAGYAKLGFERISETPPMPVYLSKNEMMRSTKRTADDIAIYNAGSTKFVKTYKSPN
ncbi:hypothetical protein [Dyadobacter psychrophilus]|uniref:Uncharacterized protein n=1 Tax=Dyadobacter psychrophilus TaxID=651661 RepID=A0A1T5ERI4_9BACT|nr:hypothetical protein [Dyadobacter psychrophilus]SKB86551.1 hypothetical protein SAMN05660293_02705 [Dyadobacter psychrophilus]